MGFLGKAPAATVKTQVDDLRKSCKVLQTTCKLVGLFMRNDITKVDLRRGVQANIKTIKAEFGLEVLDSRLVDKVKSAIAMR